MHEPTLRRRCCSYLVVDLLQGALCSLWSWANGPSITLNKSSWWVHVVPTVIKKEVVKLGLNWNAPYYSTSSISENLPFRSISVEIEIEQFYKRQPAEGYTVRLTQKNLGVGGQMSWKNSRSLLLFKSSNFYLQLGAFLIDSTKQKRNSKWSTLYGHDKAEKEYKLSLCINWNKDPMNYRRSGFWVWCICLGEKWLTIAPGSASSSPNCSARLDTACVTLSTVMVSL